MSGAISEKKKLLSKLLKKSREDYLGKLLKESLENYCKDFAAEISVFIFLEKITGIICGRIYKFMKNYLVKSLDIFLKESKLNF